MASLRGLKTGAANKQTVMDVTLLLLLLLLLSLLHFFQCSKYPSKVKIGILNEYLGLLTAKLMLSPLYGKYVLVLSSYLARVVSDSSRSNKVCQAFEKGDLSNVLSNVDRNLSLPCIFTQQPEAGPGIGIFID